LNNPKNILYQQTRMGKTLLYPSKQAAGTMGMNNKLLVVKGVGAGP
jgi:hypothetical protein